MILPRPLLAKGDKFLTSNAIERAIRKVLLAVSKTGKSRSYPWSLAASSAFSERERGDGEERE
jgi:hypothetical protein